jgi:hypothetical protein
MVEKAAGCLIVEFVQAPEALFPAIGRVLYNPDMLRFGAKQYRKLI